MAFFVKQHKIRFSCLIEDNFFGQNAQLYEIALREQNRSPDDVMQLPDIARPKVWFKKRKDFRRKTDDLFVELPVGFVQKIFGKGYQIFFSFRQFGDMDGKIFPPSLEHWGGFCISDEDYWLNRAGELRGIV